jgi:hypothetical protein
VVVIIKQIEGQPVGRRGTRAEGPVSDIASLGWPRTELAFTTAMKTPKRIVLGRILTGVAVLPFAVSCIMKLAGPPGVVEALGRLGWASTTLVPLAALEATCVVLYLLPTVSVLGAIVLTGFLGGAIATHLRVGEPVFLHAVLGLLIWGGLYLREERLQELLPVRSRPFRVESSIVINCPSDHVFGYLRSMRNFTIWNPFLKKDPTVRTEYSGLDGEVGEVLAWSGNNEVGMGEQELTRIVPGRLIEFELRFREPFEATNQGYFGVERVDGSQTRVTWGLTGMTRVPMMLLSLFVDCEKLIRDDFDSGLTELMMILESPLAETPRTGAA